MWSNKIGGSFFHVLVILVFFIKKIDANFLKLEVKIVKTAEKLKKYKNLKFENLKS